MINFIESSREKIKEALENNKLSIFVGSGVSLNSGFPSWNEIIFKFASEMGLIESFEEDKSTENYLKISEQYYIERGKKEYVETVKSLFPNSYELNEIHEYLSEIKPQNYITTNYDNLLEDMANCNFQNYNFIKSNEDLPYSITNSSIIKLHGDFEKNNFVLKESDFLSFSNDFKLVENKVKELLSSNLILFIGYSVSDPNFKLIMQTVKDTLHENFQNTYLLDINKKYSRREFDYYKNRGINVLHYDEIEGTINEELKTKKFDIIQHENGKKLYFFLRYLFDENKKNKIEKLNEEILLLDKIDYIGVEILRRNFKKYNIQIKNNNEIYIYIMKKIKKRLIT